MARKSFFFKKVFVLFWGGGGGGRGGLLGLLLPKSFFFPRMAPSLHPLWIWNIPCPHCSNLFILGGLLRHVKSVYPPTSFVSLVNKVVLSLQVSSPPMFFPSVIPLTSWGWLGAQSSSILGLFEFHFTCPHLFHRVLRTIQDEVKQAFRLPLDQIFQDPTYKLAWLLFLLLPHWCLRSTWGGCSSQQEVFVGLKKFMASDRFSLQEECSCASCAPHSHHSWEDSSTTHFCQCLILGRANDYNCSTKAF
jgi:hypothetical protein